MSDDDKDTGVDPDLMGDLLSDQAAIRARLDQIETAAKHNGAALVLTIVSVLLIGAAVYLIARELESD